MVGGAGSGAEGKASLRAFKKVQALSVASVAEGALLGKIDDLQFELATGRVYGFRLKAGVFGRIGGAPAECVVALGQDLAFVTSAAAVEWAGTPRAPVSGRAWATEYRGAPIMTRRGAAVGVVEDVVLALSPPRIIALILDGTRAVLLDSDAVALGRDSVILADADRVVARSPDW